MKEFMVMWLSSFFSKVKDEEGQGLVEYALIIVLVSIVCITALGLLGGQVSGVFDSIRGTLAGGS